MTHSCDHSDIISSSQSVLKKSSLISNSDSGVPHRGTNAESICYNCHLGHCSFPIESSYALSLSLYKELLPHPDINIAVSNFQTSPFRPPIS